MPDLSGLLKRVRLFVLRRLQRDRVHFVCLAVMGMCLALLAVSFATVDGGRTIFGPALGADYAGFYTAGAILNRNEPQRLYDFDLQNQLYHEFLPGAEKEERLPYVHPPLVAVAFRPLAALPYTWSFAVWLLLSAGLYVGGLVLTTYPLQSLSGADRVTALLLALSFEPFIIECWLGGQLSALGLFCIALAFFCQQTHRPVAAGLALGLCLYKPTLLILLFPMLVVTGNGRMLLGFGVSVVVLAGASLLAVGWEGCRAFVNVVLGFSQAAAGSEGTVLRTWKYVDLNSFFRLLLGGHSALNGVLVLATAAPFLGILVVTWWRFRRGGPHDLAWALTLTWTLVINVYVGVYDSILVVPACLLAAGLLARWNGEAQPSLTPGFKALLFLVYVAPWFSEHVARVTGFQPYTVVLMAMGTYLLIVLRRAVPGKDGADGAGGPEKGSGQSE
jgi:hypothetical protein